jgi:hypothetical protein
MIKVTFNVVGLYYGEVLDVESDNPTVLDVLRAAKGKTTNSGILEFEPNASPHENSILWIENDITGLSNPVSRKWRGDPTKARKLKKKVLRLTEGVFNQTASSKEMSLVSVA